MSKKLKRLRRWLHQRLCRLGWHTPVQVGMIASEADAFGRRGLSLTKIRPANYCRWCGSKLEGKQNG